MNTRARVTAIPALLAAAVATRIASPGALFATARDEAGSFDDLGLEKIALVMTPDAITGMPEELAAGNYLVEISGEGAEGETSLAAWPFRLPEGMTAERMPSIDDGGEDAPDWAYQGSFAGGRHVEIGAGETSSICVITLTEGNWVLLDGNFLRPIVAFTVSGEVPADAAVPESTVDVMMGEMYFMVTGGEFAAGKNTLALTSMGGQPHFLVMLPLPPGITNDEFGAMFAGPPPSEEASPEGEGEGEEEGGFPPLALLTSPQSLGTTVYTELELESGTYGLACFFPDQHVGMPHAMLNMHAVIDVP